MRHHIFLFQIISFKKYFYVSLGNNFFTVFVEAPPSCGGPGQLPSLPSLKSGPEVRSDGAFVERGENAAVHSMEVGTQTPSRSSARLILLVDDYLAS